MALNDLLIMDYVISIPDALIYALIGFVFVFVGIGILVGILYLIGFIMQKTNGKVINPFKNLKKKKGEASETTETQTATVMEEEVSDEVKAAIVAAIMAYYSVEKPKCEFVVRKIKRI